MRRRTAAALTTLVIVTATAVSVTSNASAAPVTPAAGASGAAVPVGATPAVTPHFPPGGPGAAGAPLPDVEPATDQTFPCRAGGADGTDYAAAGAVQPYLTGTLAGRVGASLAESVSCAKVVVATTAAAGMSRQAAVIALATSIVESGLRDVDYGADDSLGLFQQRPSQGWGTAAQVTDPVYATNAFLSAMRRTFPNSTWEAQPVGVVAQRVQISAFPSRYEPQAADASALVDLLWNDPSTLYSYHPDGTVNRTTPGRCTTTFCGGGALSRLDGNPDTTNVISGAGTYEFQALTGQLWRSTNGACSGAGCPGWVLADVNPRTSAVVAATAGVFEFQASTGQLWQATGSPCAAGGCSGWRIVDANPATTQVVGSSAGIYQLQGRTGQLWRFTGQPCAPGCRGWSLVSSTTPAAQVIAGTDALYAFDAATGRVWRSSVTSCGSPGCAQWTLVDDNASTTSVVAGPTGVYEFQARTGQLWRGSGVPCGVGGCPGWTIADANPATTTVVAGPGAVYQLQSSTGQMWNSVDVPCGAGPCTGWVLVAVDPGVEGAAVS